MPADELDDLEIEDAVSDARAEKVRVELPLTRARRLARREDIDPEIRDALETAIAAQHPSTAELREHLDQFLARKYDRLAGERK